jgi:hypothetical protein
MDGEAAHRLWQEARWGDDMSRAAIDENWRLMSVQGRQAWAAVAAARDAELAGLRKRHEQLLDSFAPASDGFRARLSGVILGREYRDAGLPVPDRLAHLKSQL